MDEISTILRDRRHSLGVTQQETADLSGIGINTLLAIEKGTGNPRVSTLISLLNTLGLQLEIKPKTL